MRLPLLAAFTLFPLTLLSQPFYLDGALLKSQSGSGVNLSAGWKVWSWFDNQLQVTTGVRVGFWTSGPVEAKNISGDAVKIKGRVRVGSANLLIGAEGQITSAFSAGFNIDLVGASLGEWNPENATENASVTPLNLLLGGNPDLGTLNSEFWLGWTINDRWMIRGGLNHHFTESRTRNTFAQADRFRVIENPVFLAIRWKW